MKKHLLALLSWSMLFWGAISFASCSDDDDDDKNPSTITNDNASETIKKYGDLKNATIEGDNVIEAYSFIPMTKTVTIYHFSGEKEIDKAITYVDCNSETLAKTIYNQMKEEAEAEGETLEGISIKGQYICIEDDFEEYQGLTKEELCKLLDEENSDF